jgi:hypothetical protein
MPTLLILTVALIGAEDDATDKTFAPWLQFYRAAAAEYRMEVLDAGRPRALELRPEPILHYSNPQRSGDQHGAVYVWTDRGRPMVIGSIWSSIPADDREHRHVTDEFQSLAAMPLRSEHAPRVGRKGPVPNWSSEQPGIAWTSFGAQPAPAATAPGRLLQMRQLAGEFEAEIADSQVETGNRLRLLPQPLYRYPADAAGVVDGALFAFVQATDPEVLLLVEAPRDAADEPWRFAVTRFTNRPLVVRRGEKEIWSCPKAEAYVGDQPYFLYWGVAKAGVERP